MTDYVKQYFEIAFDVLRAIERESAAAIHEAAALVAAAIAADKDFLLFGSGHSALIARDACGRAGGLVPALHIHDVADGDAERLEGVGKVILGHYDLRAGSVLVVISNSGINTVPVEITHLAQAAGLKVIAITSVAHSRANSARHPSGKKLYEVADLVIDTHAIPGDAALALPSTAARSGATSTLAGSAIIQALTVQAAGLLAERGIEPPILISANVAGGDAHNRALLAHYGGRLVRRELSNYQP